jgi:hypothetical protein
MKKCMLAVLVLMCSTQVLARGMSTQEAVCLSRIKDETDFIISRINLIHRDYEKQVKDSAFAKFKSGDYSTIGLLDNTIRKYHRKLVHQYKNYPFRYESRIKAMRHAGSKHCLVDELRGESVGSIHEFELSWQKALRQAKKNAMYFKQMDDIN